MGKEIDRSVLLMLFALFGVYAYPKASDSHAETATSTADARHAQVSAAAAKTEASQDASSGEKQLLRILAEKLLVHIDPDYAAPASDDAGQPLAARTELDVRPPRASVDLTLELAKPAPHRVWRAPQLAQKIAEKRQLEVLVAAVPDPRQSHMALFFDQALVALREALGLAGFQQERFYLPWHAHGDREHDASGERDQRDERDEQDKPDGPGIILYRADEPNPLESRPPLLVVFLVPESPVLGVSAEQAHSALSVAHDFSRAGVPLPVLGPVFSGSMSSWRDALNRLPPQTTTLVSGTATVPSGKLMPKGAAAFTFKRTVNDDDELNRALLCEICRSDPRARIATLVENGSGYGSFSDSPVDKECAPDSTGHERRGSNPIPVARLLSKSSCPPFHHEDKDGPLPPATCKQVEDLKFPLHISEVRAEHERTSAQSNDASFRRILGLKLDPREEAEPDTPASFSSLTTYDEELNLGQELVRICRDGVKYLKITATDPLDVIFLAQEARKFCPDLTIATLGWDSLYTHPDLSPALSGMLVATDYPPFFTFRNLASAEEEAPFASSSAAGYAQAVKCLVPLVKGRSFDESQCKAPQNVWITQVRSGTLWPLAAARAPGPTPAKQCPPRAAPRPNPFARMIVWLVLGYALGHAAVRAWLVAVRVLKRPMRFQQLFFQHLFTVPPAGYRAAQACTQSAADLSLGLLLGGIVPIARELLQSSTGQVSSDWVWPVFGWMFTAFGALASLLLVALGLWAFCDAVRGFLLGNLAAGSRGLLSVPIGLCVVGIYETLWLHGALCVHPDERAYFLLRVVDPLAMSPFVPIALCLSAAYLWAMFMLQRSNLLARFTPTSPLGRSAPECVRAFQDATHELHGLAHHSVPNPAQAKTGSSAAARFWTTITRLFFLHPANIVALAMFTFTGVLFCSNLRPTFEEAHFEYLFWFAFLTINGLVIFGLARFLLVSRSLFRLLRSLAAEPMYDAYTRIASKVSGSFGLQLNARVAPVVEYQIAVSVYDSLCQLASGLERRSLVEAVIADGASALLAHQHTLKAAFDAAAGDPDRHIETEARTHQVLAEASTRVHDLLVQVWEQRSNELNAQQILGAAKTEELNHGGTKQNIVTTALVPLGLSSEAFLWQRLAEDFVAMRVTTHVYMTLHSLRNMLVYLLSSAFSLVLSLHSYPFQPARTLNVFGWALVLAVVTGGLLGLIRLERNELLSRLAGKEPEKVNFDFDFVSHLVVYVVVPLGFALAGLFPEVGDAIGGILAPLKRLIPM